MARVEKDLNDHIASSTPRVRGRLDKLQDENPYETREELSVLLDQFMLGEVEAVFEDWRAQEDERIHMELAALSRRFVDRTNIVLTRLQTAAGTLFDVPVLPVTFTSSLSVVSRLRYHTDPVFQNQFDKLIFALPTSLLRRVAFRRMLTCIDKELAQNADRIRNDYLQRLEKSVATFEREIKSAIAIVADNLRYVLEPTGEGGQSSGSVVKQLNPIISQCSALG
jgi:hypothetical protein